MAVEIERAEGCERAHANRRDAARRVVALVPRREGGGWRCHWLLGAAELPFSTEKNYVLEAMVWCERCWCERRAMTLLRDVWFGPQKKQRLLWGARFFTLTEIHVRLSVVRTSNSS